MELLLTITVLGLAFALLSGAFRTPPPQIIYVQTATPETSGGLGCLPWMIAFFVLLVLVGVIRI